MIRDLILGRSDLMGETLVRDVHGSRQQDWSDLLVQLQWRQELDPEAHHLEVDGFYGGLVEVILTAPKSRV